MPMTDNDDDSEDDSEDGHISRVDTSILNNLILLKILLENGDIRDLDSLEVNCICILHFLDSEDLEEFLKVKDFIIENINYGSKFSCDKLNSFIFFFIEQSFFRAGVESDKRAAAWFKKERSRQNAN